MSRTEKKLIDQVNATINYAQSQHSHETLFPCICLRLFSSVWYYNLRDKQ